MSECVILIRLVFMGCSLLKWQFVMESLQRQLTLRIVFKYYRLMISYKYHMFQDTKQYLPFEDDKITIRVTVCNPQEKKTTLSSFTVYTVRGEDKDGPFQYEKRYSDFDHLRAALVLRWPGCVIPPLPPKKILGNTESNFVEYRLTGLDFFMNQTALLKHLWYSQQFQLFLRGSGDFQKQVKSLLNESHDEIIKRYDQVFPKLAGKGQDTMSLGRVLDFGNYCKKIIPVLTNFKVMASNFVIAKNTSNQQWGLLLNYVLPKYQENCLSVYCNKITEGKYILNEQSDQKFAEYIEKLKKLITQEQFEELYRNLEVEEREVEAFLEAIKVKDGFDTKVKDLRSKQKDLELQLVKLNAGKQGMFSGLLSNIESSKAKVNQELENIREEIKINSFMLDMVIILLGYFQIPRFRQQKLKNYFGTIKKIAAFQIEFTSLRAKICEYVLDNHNLM